MQKKLLGICGFLLFGTFGMLSGVAQVHQDEASETITLQGDGLQRQEMSDEEKERRREECATAYHACCAWCDSSNPKNESARWRCIEGCSDKNAECMKKIESNPIEKPDW